MRDRSAAPRVAGLGLAMLAGLALVMALGGDGGGGAGEASPAYLVLPSQGPVPARPQVVATPPPAAATRALPQPEGDAGVWSTPAR